MSTSRVFATTGVVPICTGCFVAAVDVMCVIYVHRISIYAETT